MAAKDKMPSFYYEIKNAGLIAKELKFHDSCYNTFTHGYSKVFRDCDTVILKDNNQPEEFQQQGDYGSVKEYINRHVLFEKKAVSMNVLHTIYGLRPYDTRYRSKLKIRIKKDFSGKISFLSVGSTVPEIIVDVSIPTAEMAFKDKDGCIIKAAEYLRKDIVSHSENLPELSWPPNLEELNQEERKPPKTLMLFFKYLLQSGKSKAHTPEYVERFMNSYASDIIGAVTQGKTITAKQFLLALGLHNITGQRKAVEIVNRLGHCLTYNTTCEIETSLAMKAQQLSLNGYSLPLRPLNHDSYVLAVFWVDNFDVKVERQTGSTHMVAFQEKGDNSLQQNEVTTIPRTRKRKLEESKRNQDVQMFVNPKTEPPLFTAEAANITEEHISSILVKYFLWLWIRMENSFDQQYASFSGKLKIN